MFLHYCTNYTSFVPSTSREWTTKAVGRPTWVDGVSFCDMVPFQGKSVNAKITNWFHTFL